MPASTHDRPGQPGLARGALEVVVLGNPKSGTTTLHDLLGQHPDVVLPSRKEPYHYAPDLCRARIGPFHPTTPDQYRALFPSTRAGQLRAESSACYVMSSVAVEAIADHNPGCRAIVLYREPVAFLRAWHLQLLRDPRHEVVPDLEQALELEGARAEGHDLPPGCVLPELLAYRHHVRYAAQLRRVRAAFGPHAVLPLLFDELADDPVGVARRCLHFLDLDPDVELQPTHHNATVAVPHPRVEAALIRAANGAPGDRWRYRALAAGLRHVPRPAYDAMRAVLRAVLHREPPPGDPSFDARLRAELAPEVTALGDELGTDLTARWSPTP